MKQLLKLQRRSVSSCRSISRGAQHDGGSIYKKQHNNLAYKSETDEEKIGITWEEIMTYGESA